MFPQWGFPSLARTLNGVPYPLPKVLNQGCRITVEEPLPAGEVLRLESHLHGVDDNGQRARLHQRLVTTTDSGGRVVADVFAYVPLAKKKKGGKHSGPPIVPLDCREIARRQLRSNAGLEFAILTGDFNPVHWLRAYARLAGFKSTILHGFGTLSIAVEAVIAGQWSGDIRRFGGVDVRFTRPLVLPAKLGVFVGAADAEGRIPLAVGKAPGGAAVMLGHIWPKEPLKLPAAASALEEQ
jgi:acyl dehydratase